MNKDIIRGDWNIAKGKIKAQFGKLTDDDLTEIEGNYDQLCGHIQKAYGLTREQVEYDLARLN